jgi:hypothetical protein
MGHATSLVTILGAEAVEARFRPLDRARAGDDPIGEVDAAVRAVLAERKSVLRPATQADGQVHLDRLFSVRHAEALPRGTKILRIGPGTVVTPLARDLLRRQGISILLGLPEPTKAADGEWAFSIAIHSEGGILQALQRALIEDPRSWIALPAGLPAATAWLQAATGRGVLFVTPEPAVVVWKACQVPGVRAALVHEAAEVHNATRGLGVNLLVIEPTGKSISWIKQLGQAFRRSGAPRLPEELRLEEDPCESLR